MSSQHRWKVRRDGNGWRITDPNGMSHGVTQTQAQAIDAAKVLSRTLQVEIPKLRVAHVMLAGERPTFIVGHKEAEDATTVTTNDEWEKDPYRFINTLLAIIGYILKNQNANNLDGN